MYLKLGYRWKMGYPKKNLPQRKMGYGTQWDIPYPIPATTPECVKFNHVCRYCMGLQKSEMGFHWDYRKVVGITEWFSKKRAQSCLGF